MLFYTDLEYRVLYSNIIYVIFDILMLGKVYLALSPNKFLMHYSNRGSIISTVLTRSPNTVLLYLHKNLQIKNWIRDGTEHNRF